MAEDTPPLLGWSLAGFHVALLVSLLVAGLYVSGAAGDLIAGLETVLGLAIYGYLWIVTWWTNRRWLETVELTSDSRSNTRAVFAEAMKWGGATGLLFLAAPLVVVAAIIAAGGGLGAIPFVLLLALVGALVAAVTGAVMGVLFAGLDLMLLWASRAVLPLEIAESTDTA